MAGRDEVARQEATFNILDKSSTRESESEMKQDVGEEEGGQVCVWACVCVCVCVVEAPRNRGPRIKTVIYDAMLGGDR